MKLQNMVGKIEGKSDKIGFVFGLLGDPTGDGRGLAGAVPFAIDRITHWKIPNFEFILHYFTTPGNAYSGALNTAVMAYLAGEGMDLLGVGHGKAAKKFAGGLMKGALVASVAFLPAINPHGDPSAHSGNSGPRGRSFPKNLY